jgi:hypothetical protein
MYSRTTLWTHPSTLCDTRRSLVAPLHHHHRWPSRWAWYFPPKSLLVTKPSDGWCTCPASPVNGHGAHGRDRPPRGRTHGRMLCTHGARPKCISRPSGLEGGVPPYPIIRRHEHDAGFVGSGAASIASRATVTAVYTSRSSRILCLSMPNPTVGRQSDIQPRGRGQWRTTCRLQAPCATSLQPQPSAFCTAVYWNTNRSTHIEARNIMTQAASTAGVLHALWSLRGVGAAGARSSSSTAPRPHTPPISMSFRTALYASRPPAGQNQRVTCASGPTPPRA